MKVINPQREAETVWVAGSPFNKVDVERGVFQRDNMEYLTGEYEAFLYGDEDETVLRVSLECIDEKKCDKNGIKEKFGNAFFLFKPGLAQSYDDEIFKIIFNFTGPEELELYRIKGRPRRLVDRR